MKKAVRFLFWLSLFGGGWLLLTTLLGQAIDNSL